MQTATKIKHWTTAEKTRLMELKAKELSTKDIMDILGRSKHAVTDMWVKINDDLNYSRNSAPWLEAEERDLIAGMPNSEFMPKYQRGQKVTNQRRFDLTRPNGTMLNKYSLQISGEKMSIKVEPVKKEISSVEKEVIPVPANVFPFTKKQLRKAVEFYNRKLRNISPEKSAAPSTYQYDIIRTMFREETSGTMKLRMHTSYNIELKAIMLALYDLTINL